MQKILYIFLGLILGVSSIAYAATQPFNSSQVGTGASNGYILQTDGTLSSWVVNSSSGSPFPFTPRSYGNSTSTTIGFLGGLISNGSTTIVGLSTGLVGNNNGLLYGFASSSLFGYVPVSPTQLSASFPFASTINYGALANSTSTPIWFVQALQASSTSYLDQINVGSTTPNSNGKLATSTFFGNVDVKGYIEDDTITNSLVFDGAGGAFTAYGGSNCSAGNAPTGINSAGTVQNCTAYLTSLAGAASSTLLGDTNTFSGLDTFTKLLTLTGGLSVNNATSTNSFAVTGSTTIQTLNLTNPLANAMLTNAGVINATYTGMVQGSASAALGGTFAFTSPSWPYVTALNFASTTYGTTTPLWLRTGLFASSTIGLPSEFDNLTVINATSTNATTTSLKTSNLTLGANALITSFTGTGLTITSGVLTNSGVTSLGNGTGINCSGTAPGSCSFATINAGVLGAQLSGSTPTSQATSTLYGVGTPGQILAFLNGGLNFTATTTFNSPLTYSNGAVSCASCLTANQSITLSGAVTGTGATAITTAFGSTATANSVLANNTGGSAVPAFLATSSLFSFSPSLVTTGGQLQNVTFSSFTYATSTAWTGTTTIPIEVSYGETFNSVRCFTDVGTLGVDFYHSTSHLNYIPTASTTKNTILFSSNNAMTDGDSTKVDVGTAASSPTKLTCTVKKTY